MTDRVADAVATVERDRYVLRPDGTQVHRTSAQEVVVEMLRLLDVREGSRVPDVGTGSSRPPEAASSSRRSSSGVWSSSG